jgi:hypothetical protein
MKHLRAIIALSLCSSCTDVPNVNIDITDARAFRGDAGRVVVDVDLIAREALGGSIGVYCTRVTFPGETSFHETCAADLSDGDTKTMRFVSDKTDIPKGGQISVAVRLGIQNNNAGRTLGAP